MDSVSFNIDNKYCNLSKQTSKISFGQIRPEHLFINLKENTGDTFGKDFFWANKMIQIIDNNKNKIKKSSFKDILSDISVNYYAYFMENDSIKSKKNPSARFYFGQLRKVDDGMEGCHTIISENTKYAEYVDKFVNFVRKKENRIHHLEYYNEAPINLDFKLFTHKSDKIPLSTILVSAEKVPDNIKASVGNDFIIVTYAPAESIKPALKHMKNIYNELIDSTKNKKKIGKKQLNTINEQIAEIHWYFAQTTPYYRGSAGIADVFTKTLYEGLGIQVSPWKRGIAPDLEAYVRPLDDYVKNYTTFFEEPPKIMKRDYMSMISKLFKKRIH